MLIGNSMRKKFRHIRVISVVVAGSFAFALFAPSTSHALTGNGFTIQKGTGNTIIVDAQASSSDTTIGVGGEPVNTITVAVAKGTITGSGTTYSGSVTGGGSIGSTSCTAAVDFDSSTGKGTFTASGGAGCELLQALNGDFTLSAADLQQFQSGTTVQPGSTTTVTSVNGAPIDNAVCTAGFGLSWLVCTLIDNLAAFNKWGREVVMQFLEFNPSLISYDSVVYTYWVQFRNVANLILLFAFMAVIFSQATSIGLSAYGIKKLLPRIMAFAIILNLSFFICQALVDVSNITGSGIVSVAKSMSESAATSGAQDITTDNVWEKAKQLTAVKGDPLNLLGIGTMAAVGTMLVPVMAVAFLSILVALAVLVVRIIVIIAMVIIAPIAIAAAVLPGTKGLFDFWKGTFTAMLVMFPIIGAIFAASDLAASIILTPSFTIFPTEIAGTDDDFIQAIRIFTAIIIFIAGFFAVPFTPGMSKGAVGKVKGIASDISKKATNKVTGGVKQRATQALENHGNRRLARFGRNPDAGGIRRLYRRATSSKYRNMLREDKAKQAQEGAALGQAKLSAANRVRKYRDRDPMIAARAEEARDEIEQKEATMRIRYEFKGDAAKAFEAFAKEKDKNGMKIAAGNLAESSSTEDLIKAFGTSSASAEDVQAISQHLLEKHAGAVKKNDLGLFSAIKDGQKTGNTKNGATFGLDIQAGVYDVSGVAAGSDEDIISQKAYAIGRQRGKTTSRTRALTTTDVRRITGNNLLKGKIDKDRGNALS